MGNAASFPNYDVASTHTASAGPGMLWKIYPATRKGETEAKVSIWVLSKADVAANVPKKHREALLTLYRRDVALLSAQRHPYVPDIALPFLLLSGSLLRVCVVHECVSSGSGSGSGSGSSSGPGRVRPRYILRLYLTRSM